MLFNNVAAAAWPRDLTDDAATSKEVSPEPIRARLQEKTPEWCSKWALISVDDLKKKKNNTNLSIKKKNVSNMDFNFNNMLSK